MDKRWLAQVLCGADQRLVLHQPVGRDRDRGGGGSDKDVPHGGGSGDKADAVRSTEARQGRAGARQGG